MRVALYARVSSYKQTETDLPISGQLKAMREYADREGHTVLENHVYIDEAKSALSDNRPAFKQMIAAVKSNPRPFEAILVWKLSRFARNREDSIIYKSLLRRHGIQVISINEQIDDSPVGRLLEGIIEVIDEFYSQNIAQDAFRGMKEAATRGFWVGGNIPIGYKGVQVIEGKTKRTKLELAEDAPLVKRMFQMCLQGYGAKEIANVLNDEGFRTRADKFWSHHAVLGILRNELYTGTLVWNRKARRNPMKQDKQVIRLENAHPAIVDKETFERIQELLKQRGSKNVHPRVWGSPYLLSGLVLCGECGHHMVGASAKWSRYFYYACQNYVKRGRNACGAKLVRKELLERKVLNRIRKVILQEENFERLMQLILEELNSHRGEHEEALKIIEAQLAGWKKKLSRLYEALETGKLELDDLAPRIKEARCYIEELNHKKVELEQRLNHSAVQVIHRPRIKKMVAKFRDLLSEGSLRERKTFLRSFIKGVRINWPKVEMEYTWPALVKEEEVLSVCGRGGPRRTRTSNHPVKSRMLFH